MSTESGRVARSKRLGETSEAAVIELVPELEPVPDDVDEHVDARMAAVFTPSSELDTCGLPVVAGGTPVEIKSASVVYGESDARGRWYFRRGQHEYLEEHGGVYLLTVCAPHSREVLAATIVPANTVRQELVDEWTEADGRDAFTQSTWSRVFHESEVQR